MKDIGVAEQLNDLILSVESGREKNIQYIKESLEWYKHERFVHLLVTVFVGLFFVILFTVKDASIFIRILDVILLILEGCYLVHYYRLENGVQKLTRLYLEKIKKKGKKE